MSAGPFELWEDEIDRRAARKDFETWRGFGARAVELVAYVVVALAEWLRPGMAREIVRNLRKGLR